MRCAWFGLVVALAAGAPVRADGLKERAVLPAQDQWVRCLAFSPDGKTVATGSGRRDRASGRTAGEVKLWDVATGKVRTVLHGHTSDVGAVAFGPDGKTLATAAGDTVIVWDLETGKERHSIRSPESAGEPALTFSPDGKTLGYTGYRTARLVDVATGKELAAFKHPGRSTPPAFSPDLKRLAVANHQDADLYDTATGRELRVLEDHRGGVYRLAFSADGKTLAVASNRSEHPKYFAEVTLWDPATGRVRAVFKDRVQFARAVALSPDGTLLAVAGTRGLSGSFDLRLIDVATGRDLAARTSPKAEYLSSLAFSPDGRVLAGAIGKSLTLWDVVPAPGGAK